MKLLIKSILLLLSFFVLISGVTATYFESSIQSKSINKLELISTKIQSSQSSITSLKLDYVFIKLTSHLEAKDILNYSKIDLNFT
ncbi:hypothetical protein LR004_01120, partial [Candidatus Gracilibacteria bacterium]|nr:hypothetical protein [Candidatus Gracilibacteria bacterium]